MESIDPVWLFGGIILLGGILLGVLLLRLFNPAAGDVAKLQAELEQARSEMESYKTGVNTHFNKTSDLMNELTQDYVKVYRHLAEGAQTLSETREFTQVLDQPQGRVLISVETQAEQATAPLAANADQTTAPLDAKTDAPSAPVEADAPVEGSDTTASESVAAVDDSPDTPVDYARVTGNDSVTEETVSAEPESVEDTVKDDDENVAAVSADEVKPSEDDTASAVDAKQQVVVDENEADSTKKT